MWWLIACAGSADSPTGAAEDSAPVAPEDTTPPPELPEYSSESAVATWSADQAVAAMMATLANEFPAVEDIHTELEAWFSHGDGGCPGEGTWMIGPSLEGCVAESGYYFLGVGGFSYEESEDDYGQTKNIAVMLDATLTSPENESFNAGGHWLQNWGSAPDGTAFDLFLNGTWFAPHAEAPWLAGRMSGWLYAAGTRAPDGTKRASIAGVIAMYGNYLRFEDVELGVEDCDGVPTGQVEIRDPSGGWWSLDFGEDCLPCGALSYEGEAAEPSVCPELGGLLDRIMETEEP